MSIGIPLKVALTGCVLLLNIALSQMFLVMISIGTIVWLMPEPEDGPCCKPEDVNSKVREDTAYLANEDLNLDSENDCYKNSDLVHSLQTNVLGGGSVQEGGNHDMLNDDFSEDVFKVKDPRTGRTKIRITGPGLRSLCRIESQRDGNSCHTKVTCS